MKLDSSTEEKIKKIVVEKIGKGGRQDWDIPHTLCSVKWMKKLIFENGGNDKILVTAMYFHDTCYGEHKRGYDYEKSQEMKSMHARNGAEFARKSLNELVNFTQKEINEVCRLVGNHDNHDDIQDENRQLVFEADGLAQIDWEDCPPNFDKDNCLKWLDKYFSVERPLSKWKTNLGKKSLQELQRKIKNYWD
jgi:hypothetical protein